MQQVPTKTISDDRPTDAQLQMANENQVNDRHTIDHHIVVENIKGQRELVPLPEYVQDHMLEISENSRKVLERRYRRKDLKGEFLESAAGMFYRVARHIAQVENEHDGDMDSTAQTFYELLTQRRFFPNSPTFTGAGTPLGQLAACFVLPIADDMGQEGDGIFSTLRVAALIQQTGGGNGFGFSRLRPRGDVVHTSSGQATGPVGFLHVYDQAFGEIAQGGCLVPNTLIFTEEGMLRLDELVNTEIRGWQEHALSVQTDEGSRNSSAGYNHGVAPILTVETEQGIIISGTPNHKVKIMTDDGPAWCRLDELEAGSAILMMLGQHQGKLRTLHQAQTEYDAISLPSVLDTSLATLLGYMAGDDTLFSSEDWLGFYVAPSSHMRENLPHLLTEIFPDCHIEREQLRDNAGITYWIKSAALKEFMVINGFLSDESHETTIPKLVRQSPSNVATAYFLGLFEAYLPVTDYDMSLPLNSEQLAHETATLLMGLGYTVTIRMPEGHRDDKPKWIVRIDSLPEEEWFVNVTNVYPSGESLTLDLEVDENHTYIANGMVTHNSRRGANMGVLRVDHPDIEDFIKCKAEEGAISNFNISVAITDEFMHAVKDDADFELRNPRDNQVWKTVRARELFDQIVTYAHRNGEPGLLFIDAANRSNPVPHLYDLEATNPCVTADTLIYTENGLKRAGDLYQSQEDLDVVIDSRFGIGEPTTPATSVYYTGDKQVYRLQTKEGYRLDATGNHQIMTTNGWVPIEELQSGDKIHILNSKGGFGTEGSLELGHTMGRSLAENHLSFDSETVNLTPLIAVNDVPPLPLESDHATAPATLHQTATLEVAESTAIPEIVYTGSAEMQQGFLQGLFSADGTVLDTTIRLWSSKAEILQGAQQLLLNFGIASRIYRNRKQVGYGQMRDGHDGQRKFGDYYTQAGHELVIAKQNLLRFQQEIGFLQEVKNNKLAAALDNYGQRGPSAEYFVATVGSVEPLGIQPVYDLTEPRTHSFIANGIVVHNCGEQWLGPYENCCLGSINLGEHVTTDGHNAPVVDWSLLERTIRESTHFLDNVVTTNKYVPVVPQVAEAAFRARRIGLGIMGLGDMMYKLGIRYGSEEGQEFAAQIMEFTRFHCMKKSIELSSQRGSFLGYKGSIYDPTRPEGMKWQIPQPIFPYARDWQRPSLDWQQIREGIMLYGIRNAAQTTVAPTGTIATVCGCEGYGCEPVFALGYVRHFKDGDNDVELLYTSPLFENALSQTDLTPEAQETIKQEVALYGSCQDVPGLPEHLRHTYVVSSDITAEQHVRMQAAIQAFIDNSISKCVVGDTLLLTAKGLVPLQELSEMRQPDQFETLGIDIVSPIGIEKSDQFYYGGYRETRKVAFDYGFEVEGTPNHRIHVLDGDGSIQFRRLDQLKPGDVAVLYGNQRQFGPMGQRLPAYSGLLRTNSKTPTFPEQMSEQLAFFLGCITSEGAISRNGVNISNNDRGVLEELNIISTELLRLPGHISQDKRNNVHYLQINSRPLRNWLLVDLGLEAGAENKIIPSCILGASEQEIATFLRGLFMDGYMTADGKLFGINVASERMIAQLQTLMLNMGVLATIRQSTDRAWTLTVQGDTQRIYQRLTDSNANSYVSPLFSHRSENKIYVTVQSVEAGYAEVFDISVPESHSFIANGLGNHNTCNFSEDATEADVAQAYQLAWELGCKGLTVYVTGSRQQVVLETKATRQKKDEPVTEPAAEPSITISTPESIAVSTNGYHPTVSTNGASMNGATMNGASMNGASMNGHSKPDIVPLVKRPRPSTLEGRTYRKETPLGQAYVTINKDEQGEPFEVFLNVGKAGSDVTAVSEAIGRLISLVLRLPSALEPNQRLRWVKDELANIGSGNSRGFGAKRVRSLPDGIAQVLDEYLNELEPAEMAVAVEQLVTSTAQRPIGDLCPECGEASFLNIEGCRKCHICGYSEC